MRVGILFFIGLCCFSQKAKADIRLSRLISNGMVLQRNIPLRIYGQADPGEKVRINFRGRSGVIIADLSGKWELKFPAQAHGGPYNMSIEGKNKILLEDIWIGDVWLCGGQSNMELMMERVKYKYAEEIKNANYPAIRQFTVPGKYDFHQPATDLESGKWIPANSKTLFEFSAVAYFFAKELYERYKVPIGLINASLGGSPAEAWISEKALGAYPAYLSEAKKFRDANLIRDLESIDRKRGENWYREMNEKDPGMKENWKDPRLPINGWKDYIIPGFWSDRNTGHRNGSAWFSKDFDIPAGMENKVVKLELGTIIDADSVFINGKYAGHTSYQYPPRRYIIPPGMLRTGMNRIVIRVINTSSRGGFMPEKPYRLTTGTDTVDLSGTWKFRAGASMKPLPSRTFIAWKPLGLFNAMIAPLTKYPIKGVIWYQGESNAGRPADYYSLMNTLIMDWRRQWRFGDFPFLFVQLANYMPARPQPSESGWAELRNQQLKTLQVKNTGMAVAIDLGEWNELHPENKAEVGKRLALLARKLAYGEKKLVASGPVYETMRKEGNKIIIQFAEIGSGLISLDKKPLRQFAIAGADKKYIWANAEIRGKEVWVWNDQVPEPVSVRYAWADNPEGSNLYNKEGLPASPFSTLD